MLHCLCHLFKWRNTKIKLPKTVDFERPWVYFKMSQNPYSAEQTMSTPARIVSEMMSNEEFLTQELFRSIPEDEREAIMQELQSEKIAKYAQTLQEELEESQTSIYATKKSRTLFLTALRCVKYKKISVAELASIHILDSAIHTLYTNPMVFYIHKYVNSEGKKSVVYNLFLLHSLKNTPQSFARYHYKHIILPREGMPISDLPKRMQKPLVQRFFNLNESEWATFSAQMDTARKSENYYHVFNAPEEGCWSGIIFKIQKVLKCMRVLDYMVDSTQGEMTEQIMLVPSFSMFQAAINAKAATLNRKSLDLVPTYGYIEPAHYATLKAEGKIALAMYFPEQDKAIRYQHRIGRFRQTIDAHPKETAFAGTIHDIYHAMRELSMTEEVARARMRLASIAKNHPNNRIDPKVSAVDETLIDGELIHSYPPEIDTMFDPDYRPDCAEPFGDIFITDLSKILHPDLKRAFIQDMVVNKDLWTEEFHLGRTDLREAEQIIYDEIIEEHLSNAENNSSTTQARSRIGFFSNTAEAQPGLPPEEQTPRANCFESSTGQ